MSVTLFHAFTDICFPERLRATLLPPVQESSHMTEEEDFHLAHALAKASAQKKHMRILLVDESAAMRRIHDRLLTQEGHTVVVTASGIEGLSAVKKAKIEAAYGHKEGLFDVVLISPLMAGMKGPQTITSMRLQGFKGVMMVTSGDATSEETVEMRKSGADCVVAKPLNIKGFKRALRGKVCLSEVAGERSSVFRGPLFCFILVIFVSLYSTLCYCVLSYFLSRN